MLIIMIHYDPLSTKYSCLIFSDMYLDNSLDDVYKFTSHNLTKRANDNRLDKVNIGCR